MKESEWTSNPPVEDGAGEDPAGKPGWERDLLKRLAFESLREQRRARRWGILFKVLLFVYLFAILFLARLPASDGIVHGEHTALVDLEGIIAPNADANADTVVAGLRAAFEAGKSKAVVLRINSPGGSPVQAGYINDEIRRLRGKYSDKPLYVVVADVCASGGYYVAAAADRIFVNKASLVGSIGVRMDGFGFVELMKKLGVERRLLTAGENKGLLDPFLPQKEEEVAHVKGLLDDIHRQFIEVVKTGRGDRLKDDPKLFSGLIWTGEQSIELGLADDYGSVGSVARDVVGAEDIVDYTPRPDFFERFSRGVGVALGQALARLASEAPALR